MLLGLSLRTLRVAYEIDPLLDRHEIDDGVVLRGERLDVSFAVLIRLPEGVLCSLGREQDACLGKCDPSPLVRWQCGSGTAKRGLGCSVELRGIGRSGSVCPKKSSDKAHFAITRSSATACNKATGFFRKGEAGQYNEGAKDMAWHMR